MNVGLLLYFSMRRCEDKDVKVPDGQTCPTGSGQERVDRFTGTSPNSLRNGFFQP